MFVNVNNPIYKQIPSIVFGNKLHKIVTEPKFCPFKLKIRPFFILALKNDEIVPHKTCSGLIVMNECVNDEFICSGDQENIATAG